MPRRATIWSCLLATISLGCESRPEPEPSVPVAEVPAAALKAARKRFPHVKIDSAWKVKAADGAEAFEVQGRDRKTTRTRHLIVTADGRVLEAD